MSITQSQHYFQAGSAIIVTDTSSSINQSIMALLKYDKTHIMTK